MIQNRNANKIINLLPVKIQEERQFEKMKKIAFSICLIPVVYYGFTYVMYLQKTNNLEDIHLIQSDIDSLQNEIKQVESNIFNNTRMISGLNNEHVPLNNFLLELGVITPKDMIIYSVITENVEQEKEKAETESNTGEEETEGNQNDETINSDDIGGSEQTEQTEEQIEEEKNKIEEEKIKNQKTMFIRGAIENVDSLGIFIKELEQNTYIEKVNMNTIENYYNGQDSFKIFELTVDIK